MALAFVYMQLKHGNGWLAQVLATWEACCVPLQGCLFRERLDSRLFS